MKHQNMASSDQKPRSMNGAKNSDDDDEDPSHNLWVGNLSPETTDSDLMRIFAKYGALDSVTTYLSRSYAFVYFKHLDDARAAKEALQGTIVCGSAIKIEFARPAKPGKHLWVGGISSAVTKEQIEDEFCKFGKVEDFKFLRDRNSALVDYYKVEDAIAALKHMNGKRLGGEQIRVDFLRSQPSRRENWSDYHDSRDGYSNSRKNTGSSDILWMPPDGMRNYPDSFQIGIKRHPPSQMFGGGRRGEGQPSKVLWIGYPPSVQIDEQMLHNAMILFGEIERIKSFPSRHYSFVEFRSIDEARRAKEGLQGRLFNDPRISIMFSSSELGPGKDNPPFFPGIRGPRPDMFFNEPPFGPGPMDFYSHNRPMPPNSFPPLPHNVMPGPNMPMRPFGPRGFDPHLPGPDMYNDMGGIPHNFPDNNMNNPMGPNWRRLSPPGPGILSPSTPGILPSPNMRPPIRPFSGWDGFDSNPFQREPKRSRVDGPSPPVDDAPFHGRKLDNQGIVDPFEFGMHANRAAPGSLANIQGQSQHSPVGARAPVNEHLWRGVIAKGGTPVCQARCVPIGKGIDSQLPGIVNCSARTGLDMLAKHYAEANGFDIVFFLPDSEEDFASYTEFLRYLGAKNRAGVAKLDDGTTLFLVPPSEFLTKVLNISGPERLYGVVLKLPQQSSSLPIHQPQPSSQTDYGLVPQSQPQPQPQPQPQKDDQVMQMDYNRVLHEEPISQSVGTKPLLIPHGDESRTMQSVPQEYTGNAAAIPPVGVSLTPELIATLAALLPPNMQSNLQSAGSSSTQLPMSSSGRQTSFPASMTPDKVIQSHGWGQEHLSREEQSSHISQQYGHPFNSQPPPFSQYPSYTNVANGPEHSAQVGSGAAQVPDPANVSSRPMNNFGNPSQGGHFTVAHANQQYQFDSSHPSQKNYGMMQPADAAAVFRSPVLQQQPKPTTSSAQVQSGNLSQIQTGMLLGTDKVNMEFPSQVQQLQSALSGPVQGNSSEGEADKNQRYQSTLQFAASLLLQIQQQQQQQQPNPQAGNQQ